MVCRHCPTGVLIQRYKRQGPDRVQFCHQCDSCRRMEYRSRRYSRAEKAAVYHDVSIPRLRLLQIVNHSEWRV